MDPANGEKLDYELLPYLRVYKNGYVERLRGTDTIPPGYDLGTHVTSKDVLIALNIGLFGRIYLPSLPNPKPKLPLVVYFHGGRFCIESAFSPLFHNCLNSLSSMGNVIILSVDYRLAPEFPLPTAYNDAWAALQWVAAHCNGRGVDSWLTVHADFSKVFLAGDSAGGNIAHNIAMRVGQENWSGLKLNGAALIHPYFWGVDPIGSEMDDLAKKEDIDRMWPFLCPSSPSHDVPWVNPVAKGSPSLSGLGCNKVMVCVAEKDVLRDRGWLYYEALKKSEWKGKVEIVETQGEDHIFHLRSPESEKAVGLIRCLVSFFNKEEMNSKV